MKHQRRFRDSDLRSTPAANWLDIQSIFFQDSTSLNGFGSGGGLFSRYVLRLLRTRVPKINSAGKRKRKKNHESIDPIQTNNCGIRVAWLDVPCRRTALAQAKGAAAQKGRNRPRGNSRSRSQLTLATTNKPTSGS